jgi:hypothetical protein
MSAPATSLETLFEQLTEQHGLSSISVCRMTHPNISAWWSATVQWGERSSGVSSSWGVSPQAAIGAAISEMHFKRAVPLGDVGTIEVAA